MAFESIPRECDWGDWNNDIDQQFSHAVYFGRSNEEMQSRFLASPVEAASELQFMPRVPFQYYMLGFRDSVVSLRHDEFVKADSGSCFLRLILHKLKHERDDIIPIMDSLVDALDFIADNQDRYDADIDIYGDFKEIRDSIKAAVNLLE